MAKTSVSISDIDDLESTAVDIISSAKSGNTDYLDLRLEIGEGIGAYSEDGHPKVTSKDWNFSLGVRVIDSTGIPAAGYFGQKLGFPDLKKFSRTLKNAIKIASARARANSRDKKTFVTQSKEFGSSITPTLLAPIDICRDTVPAEFEIDPRSVTPAQITDLACQTAAAALAFHQYLRRAEVVVNTGVSRQLFVSSQGSIIDQSSAGSGVTIFVLAQNNQNDTPVDLYHHTGNQLGLEALTKAKNAHQKTAVDFSRQIADEARLLADAKPAPQIDKPTTVILDPDLIALFAHEIIGHPSELDRALKMEAGYAGRSWFMTDLKTSVVDQQISSPLLTAFSDPTLKGGYGYYLYDDEGTPAHRVYHIKNGVYQDFMNSRQTATIAGAKPNGHYQANDASAVPLIRMSVSAIAAGFSDPKKIISEVEHGYYCVGHRIPSISESRENFQIAPRLIYEINHGRLGQIYRDGRLTADSRDFFMSIDAVGTDFKIFPIPDCGKGQPMQAKQVGNGGPTARGRAMIARGK